ncbi:MAG TPA: hypothetical protein VEL76_24595, partial [Gemmataceae bacterium]|nr:hypothetical protein [Gemmataceae bacterium]
RELEKLGTRAEAALGKALAGKPSLEVRQRLERLLQKLEGPISAPETLRLLRAVEVLEHAGTPQPREVLEMVVGGQPGTRLGRDAETALARLRKRLANP